MTAGSAATGFNDITEGDNGAYKAGPGWDACTGLGSPIGTKLITIVNPSTSSSKKKAAKKAAKKATSKAAAKKKAKKK